MFQAWPLPSIPSPSYGWYRADSLYWNSTVDLLYDISGHGKHAITNGVSLDSGIGDGANIIVNYLAGDTSSTVLWPIGSIPSVFTMCSITRCRDWNNCKRVLASRTIDWLHGHFTSKRGVAYYGSDNWMTSSDSVGILTDWLVICGKNGGIIPNNILVDGIIAGSRNGGTGSSVLSININPVNENSNWAFRELMIWDTSLSDADMVDASTALRISLLYGQV